jgi:ArsR family transcriptional regulator
VAATVVSESTASALRVKGCCIPLAAPLDGSHTERLASFFKALSNPTRVQMLHLLKVTPDPICVCDFTAGFDLGQPTVSHHLARLREAGFIDSFKRGVWAFYRLRRYMPAEAKAALELIP